MEVTTEQLKNLIESVVCNTKDYVMNNDGFINDWIKENELSKDNWIKIESKNDLPKVSDLYWHYDSDIESMTVWHTPWDLDQIIFGYEKGLVTHYQQIIKPEKPIY